MAQQEQPLWANLPKEIVEALGCYLDASGWAAARSTCTHWSKFITHGITLLEIDLERDAHRWMMVLTCVARLFPRLNSVALLCGSRITPAVFAERMAALAITSIELHELELRFLYLSNPRLGSWLEDMTGVTELRQLRLLRLAGGATPPPAFFDGLTALKHLRVLELLPGVYGQIAGIDMDMGQVDADNQSMSGSHMGVGDAHLSAIGKLTQLQQLILKVCPQEATLAGLEALTSLGLLHSLEHLALYDAELPAEGLQAHLAGASRLSSLQFGLSSVARELSTLQSLPKLRDVGLDTAFLPSLQELVSSAASAKIPVSGPGSITSLCLLDQRISSSQQLSCLSHFSSLAELVLVNPLMNSPAQANAPPSPAHQPPPNEQQQQQQQLNQLQQPPAQQQQQEVRLDLVALSGLQSLRLLQVDVGLRGPPGGGAPADMMRPVPLLLSEASVTTLAAAWPSLETLDLSGFGPEVLPEAALAALSTFSSLRALSVMHPEGSPDLHPDDDPDAAPDAMLDPPLLQGLGIAALPAPAPAAAAGSSSSSSSDPRQQRSLPWWRLPKGLVSLCLSHMDLTGGSSSQCSGSCLASSSSSGCCCCLAPAPAGHHPRQQLLQGLGLSLFRNRPSPLRPLSKRRRQTQSRTEQQDAAAAAAAGGAAGSTSDDSSAAAEAEGMLEDCAGVMGAACTAPPLCSCATALPSFFSGLQALWLERVTLPATFLPRVLPVLSTSLESLALLHVSGTLPEDMGSLSALTALTSLRLIPADHDVGGLEPLVPMRHLKKLAVRLTHLRPSDLTILQKLRSLFCLSLSAPCVNGALYPGFASAVRLQLVEEVVSSSLPYCDLEVQAEPNMTAV